jgi:hypothetical protein
MGLRTGLVFSFWAGVKEGDVGGPGPAGPDRTGPGRSGGRRDERSVTGLWISNDESSFLDEVYGLVWFSFWASVKEAAVGGEG